MISSSFSFDLEKGKPEHDYGDFRILMSIIVIRFGLKTNHNDALLDIHSGLMVIAMARRKETEAPDTHINLINLLSFAC